MNLSLGLGMRRGGGDDQSAGFAALSPDLTSIVVFNALPDVYMDSVAGSDSNNGASIYTPVQTATKAATLLSAGKRLGVKRGSHFRDQLTLPADNIGVGVYGEGAAPIFDCSEPVAAGDWALSSGKTYTYEVTVTTAAGAACWMNVWENGAFMPRAASADAVETTPGSYFPSADTTSPCTIYIHPTGSGDPATNGKTYDYSKRLYGILGEARDGITVNGVLTRRNLSENGSLFVGTNSALKDCAGEDGNKHNIFIRGGSVLDGCVADNCYYGTGNSLLYVYYQAVADGENVTFNNCTAKTDTYNIKASGHAGHASSGTFGTITANNCTSINCASAYNFANCAAGVVSGGTVTGCDTIAPITTPFTISNVISTTVTMGFNLYTGANVTARNMTMTTTAAASSILRGAAGSTGWTFDLADSAVVSCGGWCMQSIATSATMKFRNNTYGAAAFGYYDISQASTLALLDSDYNTFSNVTTDFRIVGTTYTGLATYRAGTGQDANSLPAP